MTFKPTGMLSLVAGLLSAVAIPALAAGELMVTPATTRVVSEHEQRVTVKNMGDEPMYLSISVQKVMNPGITPEQKVDLGDLERPGLIASPDKLTLGPNQSRQITLQSLTEVPQEELYRLYIIPVKSLKVDEAPKDKITAPLSVSIGYGVLVRHLPKPLKQHAAWTHRCENGGITLESTGTVRSVFHDVSVGDGRPAQTVAVFPGMPQHFATKQIKLDAGDKPVTLTCE
ncbi:TPA: pilus assembly protein [Burkholderia multivorans]|uniref:pilus assembly protein n=1 Tax=Burkholderia multivorans TaxID=87883 RepID=UPI001C21F007|nr:pilus assembly protein [Burkholderia multivorans]MBU9349851.1 pilus assembly protein [Burkholderia multivorans]MBU9394759.1 pilus assembly protein [Burkholderia multivorans]HDR9835020.1 pilus assembly protein [Burkholderia multivorans]HDR9840619.1 pilus assembly protein [Burkholderia multivorans]HDR9847556.1 pilus assembly protein [Burkholderia multivorans]